MGKKWIFFFLVLSCLLMFSGCGSEDETQTKGELVMAGSSFPSI